MGFYGAYSYSCLVRQVSGLSNVSDSAYGISDVSDLVASVTVPTRTVHVVLSTAGLKSGGKPCHKTRETAALRRTIQKTLHT